MKGGFGRTMVANEFFLRDLTTIRRVRWAADRTEAVVIAVHSKQVDGEELTLKMRW